MSSQPQPLFSIRSWLIIGVAGVLAYFFLAYPAVNSYRAKASSGIKVDATIFPVQNFSEGLALVRRGDAYGDQYGFIDESGKIVFEDEFTYVGSFKEGLSVVQKRTASDLHKFGYIDVSGFPLIELQFDDAKDFSGGLAAVKIKDKYGYIDRTGAVVIPPQFDDADAFSEDRARIVMKGRCGFINREGRTIVEPQFFKCGSFSEGLAFLCHGTLCGYVDASGALAIEHRFDDAKSFSEGVAPVRVGKKWRYIDKAGDFLATDEFDEASPFTEGLGLVGVVRTNFYDKKFGGYNGTRMAYGFIDSSGKYVIQPKFLGAEPFANGLSKVKVPAGDWFGEIEDHIFIDRNEQQMTPRFQRATSFRDGTALVETHDNAVAFIDSKGRSVLKFQNKHMAWHGGFNSPYRSVKQGFIDKSGSYLVPPRFFDARAFHNGLAYVQDRKKGFINKQGETVIALSGDMMPQDFSEGLAAVGVYDPKAEGNKTLFGYIDKSGQFVIKPQFAEALPFTDGKAGVKFLKDSEEEAWGYIDTAGKTIVSPRYYNVAPFHGGVAFVAYTRRENGLSGIHYKYVDDSGDTTLDIERAGFTNHVVGGFPLTHHDQGHARKLDAYYSFMNPMIPARSRTAPYQVGFVDQQGQFVIPASFQDAKPFSEGLAPVRAGGQWGYINPSGEMVIQPAYDSAEPFADKRALIQKDGKYGYIDPEGRIIVEPQFFEEAKSFSSGLALVKVNGFYGYLDQEGGFAIEPQFYEADSFSEDAAAVKAVLPEEEEAALRNQDNQNAVVWSRKYYEGTDNLEMEIPFVNGKAHGLKREFFPSGKIEAEVDLIHGVQSGMKRFYFENGNIDLECPMVNDKEEGECRFYYEDGSLKKTVVYREGRPVR